MRTSFNDEIHKNGESITKEEFLYMIPRKYRKICSKICHVDTILQETPQGLKWRVQGYIKLKDLESLCKNYDNTLYIDSRIGFGNNSLEIWTMMIPYVTDDMDYFRVIEFFTKDSDTCYSKRSTYIRPSGYYTIENVVESAKAGMRKWQHIDYCMVWDNIPENKKDCELKGMYEPYAVINRDNQ